MVLEKTKEVKEEGYQLKGIYSYIIHNFRVKLTLIII